MKRVPLLRGTIALGLVARPPHSVHLVSIIERILSAAGFRRRITSVSRPSPATARNAHRNDDSWKDTIMKTLFAAAFLAVTAAGIGAVSAMPVAPSSAGSNIIHVRAGLRPRLRAWSRRLLPSDARLCPSPPCAVAVTGVRPPRVPHLVVSFTSAQSKPRFGGVFLCHLG